VLGHFLDTYVILMAMKSISDSDCEQDEKGKKSMRSGEEIGVERTVAPGEIVRGGESAYLKQLKATHRARARAAMRWRPRFLKTLAMSFNWTDALKAAHVCYNTVRAHERSDPEFAAQLKRRKKKAPNYCMLSVGRRQSKEM
jgi:hypothetical protein